MWQSQQSRCTLPTLYGCPCSPTSLAVLEVVRRSRCVVQGKCSLGCSTERAGDARTTGAAALFFQSSSQARQAVHQTRQGDPLSWLIHLVCVIDYDHLSHLNMASRKGASVHLARTRHSLQLEDRYGSPSLDEISIFSRNFYHALEAKVGEKAAGELSVEVSSPVSPAY